MRLSKLCTAVFSAAAFCAAFPLMQAQAADQLEHVSGPYTYTFYDYGYDEEFDNTVSIDKIDLSQLTGDTLTIPERIDGYRVKQLNTSLLKGTNYKKVILPDCISWLGYQCFQGCTKLEEVEIFRSEARPDTDEDRGRHTYISFNGYCFDGCTNLNKITFSDRTGSIAYDVFKDCTSLESIELPENLREINSESFKGCTSLKEITIPDSVTKIYKDAFNGCTALEEIDLPASVKMIDVGVFANCTSLETVTIRNKGCQIKEPDSSSDSDAICKPTAVCGKHKSSAEYYAKKHGLTFIPLDDEILKPEDYLTFSYDELNDNYNVSGYVEDKMPAMIEIPATYKGKKVNGIGVNAFSGCETLCSVEVSEGIKRVSSYAFYYSSVQEVKLPDSVTSFGDGAFKYCSYLQQINLPEGMTGLYDETFRGCANLKELTVPRSVERIKENCFYYCSKLSLTILNPYCTFDDDASVCTLVKKITGAKDSGAQMYADKYNYTFEATDEVTPVLYEAQSAGYMFHINLLIRAYIPGTLYADPDAYCELKYGSKTYTKPVEKSMQYYDNGHSGSGVSELHRYFEVSIDPADAMKDGVFRICYGDGTVALSKTLKGTDVTRSGLNVKVYDYFDKVIEEIDPEDRNYRLARSAKDFCAATALYFNPSAGYTVSDDVKNLDLSVFDSVSVRYGGTRPENLSLELSTVFKQDPFMRLYIKFSDNSYASHTYKKGVNRQNDTELQQNSRGEYYLESVVEDRGDTNSQYTFVIDNYKIGIHPLNYAKMLIATGDARKITLGKAMYLYAKA